jgi:SP family xylose:H+ symportor-like MFS transporter
LGSEQFSFSFSSFGSLLCFIHFVTDERSGSGTNGNTYCSTDSSTFTLVAIFTVEKWGRKPLLITGSIGMGIGAICVALTFGNEAYSTLTMLSIMLYSASFMMSWGPICWVLIAEIFPNTIRGKAVAVAVAFQWIFNWIVSSSFVPMFNMHLTPGDDFGHWFTYGLYGIVCIIAAVFVWRMVPETKGMKLEDMSRMWREKMK